MDNTQPRLLIMSETHIHNLHYLVLIKNLINKSLIAHNRITALRIDLRFPMNKIDYRSDPIVITKFIESLKSKIKADIKNKEKEWGRNLFSSFHYAWAKEYGMKNNHKHYHLLILVNKDIYYSVGNYKESSDNLSSMIKQAWCSALNLSYPEFKSLVHFPENGCLYLDKNSPDINTQIELLMNRASYLAKNHTKNYNNGERSFGCSR